MLSSQPFYFASIRNLTAAFGALFNNIRIVRYKTDGSVGSIIKIPLAYGPGDKAITMNQQTGTSRSNNETNIKMILPRLSFELAGIAYAPERKTVSVNKNYYQPPKNLSFSASADVSVANNTFTIAAHSLRKGQGVTYSKGSGSIVGGLVNGTTYFVIPVNTNTFKLATTSTLAEAGTAIDITSLGSGTTKFTSSFLSQYHPVPYKFEYNLNLMVKNIDDGLQVIEQILPYFTPFYTITMKDISSIGLKRDVNITLTSVSSEDIYDGAVEDDRVIKWSLSFSADSWIYPPITDGKLIKNVQSNVVNYDNEQNIVTVDLTITDETDVVEPYTYSSTITEKTGA